ncbi:MAG: hypothetical protein ACFFDT_18850 [Candidatus Hodarchaeota archaeon]
MEKEKPIGAYSEFRVGSEQIHQTLEFHYWDPSQIYLRLQKTDSLDGELVFIKQNLQDFIDEDKLFVNQVEVPMFVETVSLSFKENNPQLPILTFLIVSGSYQLIFNEKNCLILDAEQEIATYKCQAIWNLPGSVQHVVSSSPFKIDEHQVIFTSHKGQKVGGREEIYFIVEKRELDI